VGGSERGASEYRLEHCGCHEMSQQIYRLSNDKVVVSGTAIKKITCMLQHAS